MTAHFDAAIALAQDNESGAARCVLAPRVELLVSDRGEAFAVCDHRPGAKRFEKVVSAEWAHRFLGRAASVRVESVEW